MPQKYGQIITKGSQNDAKIDARINVCLYFCENGKTLQTPCFPIENVILATYKSMKSDNKCIHNANKININIG